eukprot:TRINITY_DN23191_c0_g1_i2.p2 TRINITY_DN23191_c0_g1~~TRINITY_DN23191_c0_g1_i2.p2  ORF type:complete len:115 (+),score=38.85 TRINITY_DN23191_c0_g1_i2:64-408(+)
MCIRDRLSIKYVNMLWKCGNEKYEDIMRTCLNLLASLVPKMEYGMVEELFKQIKVGKYENEILVQFLESYTLNVIQLIISREGKTALKKCIQEYKDKLFSHDLFWKLLGEDLKT